MPQTVRDMTGRRISLPFSPRRIVSVVPSQTELLFDLGLEDEVVGITKFCVHPQSWFSSKERVGGTKKLDLNKIRSLQPDLILANKEENTREDIESLQKEFPVWISDISTIAQALDMIASVGRLVDREERASNIIRDIGTGFAALASGAIPRRAAYFIWYRPWMSIGHDTFIHSMIEAMGWTNVFKDRARYPEVTIQELQEAKPDLVLLSSEPFPFKQKHVDEMKALLPGAEVLLVDGEMFSWYGSRMIKAFPYLSSLLQR